MTFKPRMRRFAAGAMFLLPMLARTHGISDVDKQRMLEGGYLQYVGLGATHMLTGDDHLLFSDPAAANKSKETRFMFFTARGNFIAANVTGKQVAHMHSS